MKVSSSLALWGGSPVIDRAFPRYSSLGAEEVEAATSVVKSGRLSGYIGNASEGFMGGEQVRALEREAEQYFGVRHCLAVNSWTSGLTCAVGALGLEPGDEIITSPWTMAATATVALHWNLIPVFADIDATTFNLDPLSVEEKVTSRTKAIIVPDIFGQSADMQTLTQVAKRHDLHIVSDSAQAPGALHHGKFSGTIGDIGGFSLNYHKHINCGEGGLIVTNDDNWALRMALIRNHGEVLLGQGLQVTPMHGILGRNYRMGEIEAAIARCQLPKLKGRVLSRQLAAERLTVRLGKLPGLITPVLAPGNTHSFYVYPLVMKPDIGVPREVILRALRAEGVPALLEGYQNIHRLPLFSQRRAYGRTGFPYRPKETNESSCPVAERLHDRDFFGLLLTAHEFDQDETDLVCNAFEKVWQHLDDLRM